MNEPDKIPKPDMETQHKFTEGYLIDELAKKQFTSGIDIVTNDFMKNIWDTQNYLKSRKPLFEAGFKTYNLFARADILNPVQNKWELIEIKSSTEVKDVNVFDVAFQKHCYEKAGIKIEGCFLIHVNNQYIRNGAVDASQLLIKENITQEVDQNIIGINDRIKNIFSTIKMKSCPKIDIGEQCSSPYPCPLIDNCWGFLPDDNVFNLYFGGQKKWNLYKSGIYELKDIPDNFELTERQEIQRDCAKTGDVYINKQGIQDFLDTLQYPLYFLDFETFSAVIPLFDNIRPYQNIPFQFSLHILDSLGNEPVHYSFLASGNNDPREDFLNSLQKLLGSTGSIVVYNQSFEKMILEQLALIYPSFSAWIESVTERFVDLLKPFRSFHYYNPSQHGSASLKKVLPAITGKGYDDLEIADGMTASLEYLYMTFGEIYGKEIAVSEQTKIRQNLEEYCGLDTEGMIWILKELENAHSV